MFVYFDMNNGYYVANNLTNSDVELCRGSLDKTIKLSLKSKNDIDKISIYYDSERINKIYTLVISVPKCNYKCEYCLNINSIYNNTKNITDYRIVDDLLKTYNVENVMISGGNPSSYGADLINLLDFLYSRNIKFVSLLTTISNITDNNFIELINSLKRFENVDLVVTIGGNNKSHPSIAEQEFFETINKINITPNYINITLKHFLFDYYFFKTYNHILENLNRPICYSVTNLFIHKYNKKFIKNKDYYKRNVLRNFNILQHTGLPVCDKLQYINTKMVHDIYKFYIGKMNINKDREIMVLWDGKKFIVDKSFFNIENQKHLIKDKCLYCPSIYNCPIIEYPDIYDDETCLFYKLANLVNDYLYFKKLFS